jgi:hypothetical protein
MIGARCLRAKAFNRKGREGRKVKKDKPKAI